MHLLYSGLPYPHIVIGAGTCPWLPDETAIGIPVLYADLNVFNHESLLLPGTFMDKLITEPFQ